MAILFNFSLIRKIWWEKTTEVKNSNRIFQLNKRNECETDLFSFCFASKSIEWFIEDQAISPSYDLAPQPPSSLPLSYQQLVSSCVSAVELTDGRGGSGWGRSQIIRMRESLVLYKSFNTLWVIDLNRTRICLAEGKCAQFGHNPTLLRNTV